MHESPAEQVRHPLQSGSDHELIGATSDGEHAVEGAPDIQDQVSATELPAYDRALVLTQPAKVARSSFKWMGSLMVR